MVVESPRTAGRPDASPRAGRLGYFRISGADWVLALVALAGVSTAALVAVGPLDLDSSGVLARSAAPIVLTMAAIGLLTSGRRVRGRHRRLARPAATERPTWTWAGTGLLLLAASSGMDEIEDLVPNPPQDEVALVGLALLAVAISLVPRRVTNRHGERRVRWDAFAAATGSGSLVWVVVDPSSPFDVVQVVVAAGMAGAVAYSLLRSPLHRSDAAIVALSVGAVGLVAARLLASRGWTEVDVGVIALVSGSLALTSAVAARRPRVPRNDASTPGPLASIAPYLPAAVLAGVAVDRLMEVPSTVVVPAAGLLLIAGAFAASRLAASREAMASVEIERDRMVASVSHELRTPLTALTGFSELLASDWARLDDDQREEMVTIIRDESRRVAGLVSDMASLVTDRMQSVDLEITQHDGKKVIAAAIRTVFERHDPAGFPIFTRIEPYFEVMADRARLEQVLVAVLDNARRYGARRILVDARRQGAWRVIEVHDDGPGLSDEDLEVVWERFRRGTTDVTAGVAGAGLGLTKSRALIEAHGGDLSYRRSEDLGGACFSLRLPLDRSSAPAESPAPVRSTFPARPHRIHSPHPGPVAGRFGPSPALSRWQSLP